MKSAGAKRKGDRFERKIASMVGGQRAPLSGATGTNDIILPSDAVMSVWGMEVKARKAIPAVIKKALLQAETALKGEGRKPAVVIQEDRGRPIFVAYLEDVVTWAERLDKWDD